MTYAEENSIDIAFLVMNEKAERIANKEENLDDLIMQMAEAILKENENYIGTEVMQESIEKLEKSKATKENKEKRGGNKDGKKIPKTTRGNSTKSNSK